MVELKAVIRLEDVHLAQAMNYLEAYNMEIGLLSTCEAWNTRECTTTSCSRQSSRQSG